MFTVIHALKDFPEWESYRFLKNPDLEKDFVFGG